MPFAAKIQHKVGISSEANSAGMQKRRRRRSHGCGRFKEGLHGYFHTLRIQAFWPAGLQLLEAITAKVNANLQNRLVVTNSFHGEPCALRADITLGVVDYCASHFEAHERPLRLCYTERIYRRPKSDKNMERLQMGAELIGWEGEGAESNS